MVSGGMVLGDFNIRAFHMPDILYYGLSVNLFEKLN